MTLQKEIPAVGATGSNKSNCNLEIISNNMKAINFKPFQKNTLVGFFDLELSTGMVLRGCTLHRREERSWVGLPARPYEKEGKQTWAAIIDFKDEETRQSFQKAALETAEVAAHA